MELRQLEYVVALAEHGSFSAAAVALGVAQPSVSQGVRALEHELGVTLVERMARGSTLTTAGRALLPSAQAALRDVAAGRAAVDAVLGLTAGTLDLVCLATLAAEPTARLVGELRRRHPGVRVRIAQPETVDDVLERVRAGHSELAVTELGAEVAGLTTVELQVQDFVALVPESRKGRVLSAAALADEPLVTAPPGTSTRRQLDEVFAGLGRTPRVVVETEHREATLALVAAGAGIAVVPRPPALPRGIGVAVAELRPAVRRRVGLVHRDVPLAPAALAFVALASPGSPATTSRPRARRRRPGG